MSIYIYRRSAHRFDLAGQALSPHVARLFGVALALQGNTLVVGAPATMGCDGQGRLPMFGFNVTLNSNTLAVGAP